MGEIQIDRIRALRKENYTYACIGKVLGLSTNTVKSICRRHNIVPDAVPQKNVNHSVTIEQLLHCKFCGRIMDNLWNRKKKEFCSDKCRYDWWNRERKWASSFDPKEREDLSKKRLDSCGQKRD